MPPCQEYARSSSRDLLEVTSEGDELSAEPATTRRGRRTKFLLGCACVGCLVAVIVRVAMPAASLHAPSFVDTPRLDGEVELSIVGNRQDNELNVDQHYQPASHQDKQGNLSDPLKKCAWGQENCNATRCCNNPGMKCYQQHGFYAQCRESCTPGPNPQHWDGEDWTCKALGERSAGSSSTCSGPGEDCSSTACCTVAGTRCFEKMPGWSACKAECSPGAPDLSDNDNHFWSCKKLGGLKSGAASWVQQKCGAAGEDCRHTRCCKTPGQQCYNQSKDWASCRDSCTPGKDPERPWETEWNCEELGMRTPGVGAPPPATVASWVPEKCSWDATDCKGSRCCIGMNKQCYRKDENFAMCLESCQAGSHPDDNNDTWSCETLGARSKGLAVRGDPSLFCFSLFQQTSYEMDVLKNQLTKGLGIFQCDGYLTLSTASEPVLVGTGPGGEEVKSLHVDMAEITRSVDGTAGNAALFINCWNVVLQDGRWNNYAWTLKVDPDAVLLPDRLRSHVAPYNLQKVYILNCNAYPDSPEFPMMYGSLEVLSWRAMQAYGSTMWMCMRDMSQFIPQWGEDRFMKHCLDLIGVVGIQDFSIIGDGVCTGVDCGSPYAAAFHPFKSVDSWQQCWDRAQR